MQIDVNITSDLNRALAKLDQLSARQLPFAAARALTWTAKEVQTEVRAEMPKRFTIRRQWVVQGIRIVPATKQRLVATVYSKDPFMRLQEEGGTKTGKPGGGQFSGSSIPTAQARSRGGRVAIPTDKVLRTKREIIRKSDLPQGLGRKAFVIKGTNADLLVRRFAKGKRAGLQTLYVLKRSTQIKPRLGLKDIGTRVARARFGANLQRSLQQAIQNAKP